MMVVLYCQEIIMEVVKMNDKVLGIKTLRISIDNLVIKKKYKIGIYQKVLEIEESNGNKNE